MKSCPAIENRTPLYQRLRARHEFWTEAFSGHELKLRDRWADFQRHKKAERASSNLQCTDALNELPSCRSWDYWFPRRWGRVWASLAMSEVTREEYCSLFHATDPELSVLPTTLLDFLCKTLSEVERLQITDPSPASRGAQGGCVLVSGLSSLLHFTVLKPSEESLHFRSNQISTTRAMAISSLTN